MSNESVLRKYRGILKKIKSYKDQMEQITDEELSGLTASFKQRLAAGETLDELLPEAFAAVCEADRRVLGMFPYDVQILGGIALHHGYLAEMNTGEGKTLVATMPLYLNALSGKGVMLVTTNEYLATRDAEEMGQVYRFMGLTVAAGVSEQPDKRFNNAEKKQIYACDIVYTTHSAFGFDYLFNNLVTSAEEKFLRELFFVIIDEADSVLLDSAQTPLVISGAPRVQSNLFELADFFVTLLQEEKDYEREEKKVWLTDVGVAKAERFFQIDNFYAEEYFDINRHVILALRAHVLFEMGKDYMVSGKGEILLLDGESGRMMPGVKLRGGQHQALEMKEKLKVTKENRSVASITYQNLFLLFEKMSGMSGTISDAAEELLDVYGLEVLIIPTNKKKLRKDLPDLYFDHSDAQVSSAMEAIRSAHGRHQPVLIVVSTIGETELISSLLIKEGIAHNVLNANNAFWEAGIIKEAGQKDAVTVATSMAGRGTDIKLGKGVHELGGLYVIGIGRMTNVRQERQARGRAGRQGDPGISRFYVSLQDEVVVQNGPKQVQEKVLAGKSFRKHKCKKIINYAQELGEENAVQSRKQSVEYDQVLRQQRNLMYETRDDLLLGGSLSREKILEIASGNIETFCKEKKPDRIQEEIDRYVLDHISYHLDARLQTLNFGDRDAVSNLLLEFVEEGLEKQEKRLGSRERMQRFVRIATLRALDDAWVDEVDYLQQLQYAVKGRSYAQRNPVFEFQKDAFESFEGMKATILDNVIRNILLSNVSVDASGKMQYVLP